MTSTLKTTESALEDHNDGIPTLYEELNRKTLDVALDLVLDFESQKISSAQFYTGFNVLFGTVSGLASRDTTEFAFEGSKMVAKYCDDSFFSKRSFFKKGAVKTSMITVSYQYGEPKAIVTIRNTQGETVDEKLVLKSELVKFAEDLVKIGYQELT